MVVTIPIRAIVSQGDGVIKLRATDIDGQLPSWAKKIKQTYQAGESIIELDLPAHKSIVEARVVRWEETPGQVQITLTTRVEP